MDISIIIPVYNVEEYLTDCLNSVKRNIVGLTAEVLLIDDGSIDNSTPIAKSFAEEETGFSYYRTENRGLSCARNYGATLATGKYLFFMDSDDLLEDGILLKMFLVAERNKTDLTICNVCKMKEKSFSVSPIHVRAFHNLTGNVTHIKSHPALAYDSTAWNKLILRSFYIKNGFFFPDGFQFEDMPVITRMHYCANAVSVIRSTGYLWRIRTGSSKSISQRYVEKRNLTDKIEMIKRLLAYINANVPEPEIKNAVMSKILNVDFEGYYDRLRIMKREDALEYVELIADFVEGFIEKDALKRIPLKYQQLYYDILNRDMDHLLRVINYKNANYSRAPIVQEDGQLKMLLPAEIFTIENRDITYEFTETPPNCYLDFVEINGSAISIKGHVYFRRVDTLPSEQSVDAILVNDISGTEILLETKPVESSYQTTEQGILMNYDDYRNYYSNYDGTGFQIDIDFGKFPYARKWNGDNLIILKFKNRICSGRCILTGVRPEARQSLGRVYYKGKDYTAKIRFDKQNAITIVMSK